MEDYFKSGSTLDPLWVKPFVRLYTVDNGKESAREIPTHRCTEEDYAQFYPVEEGSIDLLEKLKNDPKRGLYCIDFKANDIVLQGNERNKLFQYLDINFLPCN